MSLTEKGRKTQEETEKRELRYSGRRSSLNVKQIGISSAYRSPESDEELWHDLFRRKYYPQNYKTLAQLSRLVGGRYGHIAQSIMIDAVKGTKSAPGYRNHTRGIAVDFFFETDDGKRTEADVSPKRIKEVNAHFEESWLYRWLCDHSQKYKIHRIETEAWHWERSTERRGRTPGPVGGDALFRRDDGGGVGRGAE